MTTPSPLDRLRAVVAVLRGPEGCPWDRRQTASTLRDALVEEAHEVVDAIAQGDAQAERDELGDLLFLVVMLSRIAEERGAFTLDDVAQAASDKMVRRHPHVFGDAEEPPDWHALKAAERPGPRSVIDRVGDGLAPLQRAVSLGDAASTVGFDWPDVTGVRRKVDEELAELDAAVVSGAADAVEEELGDVLFSLAMLSRHLGTPAHHALAGACRKFSRRFRAMEAAVGATGGTLAGSSSDALESAWSRAKEVVG